eukprot:Hpha_TRINITY_DN28508_c0_g1::TRINITY_DN28508_c0_g1_i1::g.18571::m.18571
MGGCSSAEEKSHPVQSHFQGRKTGAGIGTALASPREGPCPTNHPTGHFDEPLYNTLPAHELAHEIKLMHPKFGGPQNGVFYLTFIFVAIRNLRDHGRYDPQYQYLDAGPLQDDERALTILRWFGFRDAPNSPPGERQGHFELTRREVEIRTALQYMEAVIGGVPP